MKSIFNTIAVVMLIISIALAIWSFFFMFNTASSEILDGNWYGLLGVASCLLPTSVTYMIWKGLKTKRRMSLTYAYILAALNLFVSFGFCYDYTRHYDNWVDGTIIVEGVICNAQFEKFDVFPSFMENLLFGFGAVDMLIAQFIGYTLISLLALILIKHKINGSTIWKSYLS